jgi:hypothetical protein
MSRKPSSPDPADELRALHNLATGADTCIRLLTKVRADIAAGRVSSADIHELNALLTRISADIASGYFTHADNLADAESMQAELRDVLLHATPSPERPS